MNVGWEHYQRNLNNRVQVAVILDVELILRVYTASKVSLDDVTIYFVHISNVVCVKSTFCFFRMVAHGIPCDCHMTII